MPTEKNIDHSPTGLDEDDEGIAIVKRPNDQGGSYFLPASMLRLKAPARESYVALRDWAEIIRDHEDLITSTVPRLREAGASWSHVGAALGITGEAARLRYRDLED